MRCFEPIHPHQVLFHCFYILEMKLNFCSHIFILSTLTGSFRVIFGLAQILIFAPIFFVYYFFQTRGVASHMIQHGILNIGRGLLEMTSLFFIVFYANDKSTNRFGYRFLESTNYLHLWNEKIQHMKNSYHTIGKAELEAGLYKYMESQPCTQAAQGYLKEKLEDSQKYVEKKILQHPGNLNNGNYLKRKNHKINKLKGNLSNTPKKALFYEFHRNCSKQPLFQERKSPFKEKSLTKEFLNQLREKGLLLPKHEEVETMISNLRTLYPESSSFKIQKVIGEIISDEIKESKISNSDTAVIKRIKQSSFLEKTKQRLERERQELSLKKNYGLTHPEFTKYVSQVLIKESQERNLKKTQANLRELRSEEGLVKKIENHLIEEGFTKYEESSVRRKRFKKDTDCSDSSSISENKSQENGQKLREDDFTKSEASFSSSRKRFNKDTDVSELSDSFEDDSEKMIS